uniref:TTC28 C-terminal domain-containing protein n=1 Tax=Musca domestica TaxID=7370 RepID=T1PKA7_MUSDO
MGFDLTEVGQDQVTLRTGKQANRRICQFVLQALLALFDTQEAPKSLGLDSSSSCESLIDDEAITDTVASGTTTNHPQLLVAEPSKQSQNVSVTLPPLPINRSRLISTGGGAFISYVRRRGEPDGGRTDNESIPTAAAAVACSSSAMYPALDSSLNNTTDSELSDGYISQTNIGKTDACRLGSSTLRGPVRVSRPGGGGESDAAFTPSPPVTTQNPVDPNVSMALAHQTRIRNLYSGTGMGYLGDSVIPEMTSNANATSRRPDSSSSASSTTDWEGSGHATVLRRGNHMPPLPPPRQNMPLVDSLRPLAPMVPVYNNLNANLPASNTVSNAADSNSSESEFERSLKGGQIPMSQFRLKPKIKLGSAQSSVASRVSKEHALFMDRLNVRAEPNSQVAPVSQPTTTTAMASGNNTAGSRKPINLPEDDDSALVFNASNLYFSQSDNDLLQEAKKDLKPSAHSGPASSSATPQGAIAKDANSKPSQKTIQDSIMRHMNREMTPTISEVYHERNLGLGLAPPLSQLLLSKNYEETETCKSTPANTMALKSLSDAVNDIELSGASSTSSVSTTNTKTLNTQSSMVATASHREQCPTCGEPADIICRCNAATVQKKASHKPWLSNVPSSIVKASDLTTADILERQNKIRTSVNKETANPPPVATSSLSSLKRVPSPFTEFCRRDEGDGRSVADSQCSSNYKNITIVKAEANQASIVTNRKA